MSDPTRLPRVYGEKEIGSLLKRATELQHREPSAPASGMTLADLEEIATEAGIDPSYLRQAAMEMDAGVHDTSFWTKIVGDELVLVREITLDGELAADGFEHLVAVIQTASREHGQPSLLGRTLTWRAETASKTRTMQIVVTSRDGRTHIRLEENLTQTAVGWMAGMTAGAGLGFGLGLGLPIGIEVLGSVLFSVAAPLGAIGVSFIAARGFYRAVVNHRRKAVDRMFERLVGECRDLLDRPEKLTT